MDLSSAYARATTLATHASKGFIHALYTYAALHPRTATVLSLILILASGVIGFAVGVGA